MEYAQEIRRATRIDVVLPACLFPQPEESGEEEHFDEACAIAEIEEQIRKVHTGPCLDESLKQERLEKLESRLQALKAESGMQPSRLRKLQTRTKQMWDSLVPQAKAIQKQMLDITWEDLTSMLSGATDFDGKGPRSLSHIQRELKKRGIRLKQGRRQIQ